MSNGRNERLNCGNCRFLHATQSGRGECRINPPKRNRIGKGCWPEVEAVDWCGKWALGEVPGRGRE